MIADPLTLAHLGTSVTRNFVRTMQDGSQSEWIETAVPGLKAKVSHAYSGKNKSTRRSLLQLQLTKVSAEGISEQVTANYTLAGPTVRTVITDTEVRDLLGLIQLFSAVGSDGWSSNDPLKRFLRGEY